VARRLTKQAILEGSSRRETIFVKGYDAEVVIRPLTDGELTKVFAVLGNISLRDDGTPNISKIEVSKNL
jgi:phosphopantothenate synthetase